MFCAMNVQLIAARPQTVPAPLPLLLLYALLLPLLAACGKAEPTLQRLSQDAVILAFGDSLTYGTGVAEEHSYPEVLQRLSGRTVINAGIPGELSAQGRQRLPELLDEYRPQLLILCHGGNDILRRKPAADTVKNLRAMIQAARARNIEVVLVGVPEFALLLFESAAFYVELAEEMGIPIEKEILPRLEGDSALKSDQIHFNREGYRQMAESIYRLLVERGAL